MDEQSTEWSCLSKIFLAVFASISNNETPGVSTNGQIRFKTIMPQLLDNTKKTDNEKYKKSKFKKSCTYKNKKHSMVHCG